MKNLDFTVGRGLPGTTVMPKLGKGLRLAPGTMPSKFWFYPVQGTNFYMGVRHEDAKVLRKIKDPAERRRATASLARQELRAARMGTRSPGRFILVEKSGDTFTLVPVTPVGQATKSAAALPAILGAAGAAGAAGLSAVRSDREIRRTLNQARLARAEGRMSEADYDRLRKELVTGAVQRAALSGAAGGVGGAVVGAGAMLGKRQLERAYRAARDVVGQNLADGAFRAGEGVGEGVRKGFFKRAQVVIQRGRGDRKLTAAGLHFGVDSDNLAEYGRVVQDFQKNYYGKTPSLNEAVKRFRSKNPNVHVSQAYLLEGAPGGLKHKAQKLFRMPAAKSRERSYEDRSKRPRIFMRAGRPGSATQYNLYREVERGLYDSELNQPHVRRKDKVVYASAPEHASKKDSPKYSEGWTKGERAALLGGAAALGSSALADGYNLVQEMRLDRNKNLRPKFIRPWVARSLQAGGLAATIGTSAHRWNREKKSSSIEKSASVGSAVVHASKSLMRQGAKGQAYRSAALAGAGRGSAVGAVTGGVGGAATGALNPGEGQSSLGGAVRGGLVGAGVGAVGGGAIGAGRGVHRHMAPALQRQARMRAASAAKQAPTAAPVPVQPKPVAQATPVAQSPAAVGQSIQGPVAPAPAAAAPRPGSQRVQMTRADMQPQLVRFGGQAPNASSPNIQRGAAQVSRQPKVDRKGHVRMTKDQAAAARNQLKVASLRDFFKRAGLGPHAKHASANQEVIESPHSFHPVKLEPPRAHRKKYPFQGYIDFQGIKIDVENKRGSFRSGTDSSGEKWSTKMHHHYGEIRGTEGADGDKLDVYVGPNHDSGIVVVVHQHRPKTGAYDEDKVMLGFDSVEEAIGAYKAQYSEPGYFVKDGYTAMPIGRFWRWVHDRKKHGKKVASSSNKKQPGDTEKARRLAAGVGAAGLFSGMVGHPVAAALGESTMHLARNTVEDADEYAVLLEKAKQRGVAVTDTIRPEHLKRSKLYAGVDKGTLAEMSRHFNDVGTLVGPNYNPALDTVHIPSTSPRSAAILAHELGHARGAGRLSGPIAFMGGIGGRVRGIGTLGTSLIGARGAYQALSQDLPKEERDKVLRNHRNAALLTGGAFAAPTLLAEGVATGSALSHAARTGGLKRVGSYAKVLGPAYGSYLAATLAAPAIVGGGLEIARRHHGKKVASGAVKTDRTKLHTARDAALVGGSAYYGNRLVNRSAENILGAQRFVHGTNRDAAKAILREGLAPRKGGAEHGAAASIRNDTYIKNSKNHIHVARDNILGRRIAAAHSNLTEAVSRARKSGKELSDSRRFAEFLAGYTTGRSKGQSVYGAMPHEEFHTKFKRDPDMPKSLDALFTSTSGVSPDNLGKRRAGLRRIWAARSKDLPKYWAKNRGRVSGGALALSAAAPVVAAGGYAGKRLLNDASSIVNKHRNKK